MQQENAGTSLTVVPQTLEDFIIPFGYGNLAEYREALQNYNRLLNMEPPPDAIEPTPDGKAKTIVISHVEMQLDKLYFGLWETENFKWTTIANEVVGSLDLVLTHPVTGKTIRRQGAAGIIIQVNKAPDNATPQVKSVWANDPNNKKANALDLGFPKLKAECIKNAAQSIGKIFGRDLNRKKAAQATQLNTRRTNGSQKAANAMDATLNALKS